MTVNRCLSRGQQLAQWDRLKELWVADQRDQMTDFDRAYSDLTQSLDEAYENIKARTAPPAKKAAPKTEKSGE